MTPTPRTVVTLLAPSSPSRGAGRFRDEFHVFAEKIFDGPDALEAAYEWAEQQFAAARRR